MKPCTCHPDDSPPVPCAKKYALSDCKAAAWRRYRFHANFDDPRPVTFPPPGPWWESGFAANEEYSVVVCYLPMTVKLKHYWPEASEVTFTDETEIHFTDRFPEPDWWKENMKKKPKKKTKGY